jgi:hypothetical protein
LFEGKFDGLAKSPSKRPGWGAQINDRQGKSLICEESENDTFRFPWSKKFRLDFLRPYQSLTSGVGWI